MGKSGAGKSTLGNKLLNARLAPDEAKSYFREGGGCAGVTGKVESHMSTDGRVKVIDTPGIPDPNPSNTIAYFNTVVQTIRDVPHLNLLIFVAKEDRTDEKQFGHYRTLLKQFNYIPCQKLMVCRQSAHAHRSDREAREMKRREGVAFVTDIQKRSGMDMPFMLYVDGTSDEAEQSFQNVATYADASPRVSLGPCPSLRTYPELRSAVRRLASRKDRLEELEKKIKELRREVEHKRLWLEISKVCKVFLGESIALPLVCYSERTTEISVARLNMAETELATASVDEGMLDECRRDLDELEALGR